MRNGEGILELDRRNQPRDALDQSPGSGCSSPAVNNNREVQQQQNLLDRTWGAHSPASVEMQGAAELCRRHRLITTPTEWPVLAERSNPLTVIDSKWGCATRDREGAVFELARRFGELGVGAVPKMLFKAGELPQCSCQSAHRPAGGGVEPGDDPTETSDALLVLEGLGNGDVDGLDLDECPEDEADDENGRREFLLNRKREIVQKMSGTFSITLGIHRLSRMFQPSLRTRSKKGSLKIRLSKLFRTKSCSGSSHLLDKRPSVTYSVSSAGSLVDMACAAGAEQDADRVKSCETVSLVDVDISQRGANTPHPPTPPPPPRRSLSLLDAFLRALPHSNPADAPPPIRQAPPPMLCALRRSEASNFTASLRELEKCGWYWGPMNWEDAEMKLKGKPDGSFLVRDSSDPRYILSLSFRSQGVTHHTRMEHYRGTFSLWCHPKFEDRCHSVVEFIERAIMHSKNGKFLYFLRSRVPGLPPTPVQLLYPVSRFSNVKSLQHLCRFCIRQIVRIDHIQELPLPRPLISYLSKFYYYDPEEEMYLSIKSIRRVVGVEQEAEST
uniref:Suppressor of cytokine signaling 7 n=1 Tax=Amphilophus citrinellus TaxID=61819 RepID=A0A3Q0RWZ0_AMPCI